VTLTGGLVTVSLADATPSHTPTRHAPVEVPAFANPPVLLGHCDVVVVPVTLPGVSHAQLTGHLCTPLLDPDVTTVEVLLHGATYNASYWSWPLDPARQSFTWAALRARVAVFAVDRLGYGLSTRPAAATNTFAAQTDTLHQVFTALRVGITRDATRYRTLVGVAHSFGSAELDNEAATYPRDLDALVLTGSGSHTSVETTTQSHALAPAATVNATRFTGMDPGYLTSATAAARQALLYDPTFTPPGTVAFDFATEDTLGLGEVTSRPASLTALTLTLRMPVLLVDGQRDSHYCDGAQAIPETGLDDCASSDTLYASERANYNACFAAAVVPHSGHDLTTADGARDASALIQTWVGETVDDGRARCATTGGWRE
jgi:pimeloyl-ACP methyl ester carboxylesterase